MTLKRERIFDIAVFLFTAVWFSFFAAARIDIHHDAVMLKPAIDVAAGRVLFRESFCQYGALAVWLQALAVKLFGGELVVIQLLTVLFYGGIAVLCDMVLRRFLSFPFRLVNLALFWGMAPFYVVPMHPWSSVYALFFMLLTTEFLLRHIVGGGRRVWIVSAGICAACAFLARHPCGVVSFAAGMLTLIAAAYYLERPWRDLGWFSVGAAAVVAAFALYLALAGAWSDYLRQCFGFVGTFALERGGGRWSEMTGRLFPIFDGLFPFDIFYSILPFVCLAAGFRAFFGLSRGESAEEKTRMLGKLAVVLAALASWHQYYPVPCVRHLYWAAVPMFGAFALECQTLWRSRTRRPACRAGVCALLLAAALPVGARMYFGVIPFFGHWGSRRSVDVPGLRHLRLSGSERLLVESFRRAYEELPPEIRARGVFNYSPDAVLSVMLPETSFRHPMFVNWGGGVYPGYPALAMAYLLRHRPAVVCCEELPLPGYGLVCRGELYGREYRFYAPAE